MGFRKSLMVAQRRVRQIRFMPSVQSLESCKLGADWLSKTYWCRLSFVKHLAGLGVRRPRVILEVFDQRLAQPDVEEQKLICGTKAAGGSDHTPSRKTHSSASSPTTYQSLDTRERMAGGEMPGMEIRLTCDSPDL
jgi:hypothetical protein